MTQVVFKARCTGVGFGAMVTHGERIVRLRFSRNGEGYVSKPEELPPGEYDLHVVVAGEVGDMAEVDGFDKETDASVVNTRPVRITSGSSGAGTFGFGVGV